VPLFVEEVTCWREASRAARKRSRRRCNSRSPRGSTGLERRGTSRKIGAVLGRGFSYALVRDVAGAPNLSLGSSLQRLGDADILFVEGAAPQSNYWFRHALIRDAAYESLLKSRRQALHRRAPEILRDGASPEPEAIAHHFTEAGLDDLAMEWWGKAGPTEWQLWCRLWSFPRRSL
jgi:hypothetical protein